MPTNECNGLVIGQVLGKIAMVLYVHDDGLECSRPGDVNWSIGTLVESTFERIRIDERRTLCEHVIVAVHEPEVKPQAPVTVQNIVQTTTAKAKPAVTEDAPVSADVIERAKVPPKIKVDLSTSPAAKAALATTPIEDRYEYDLSPEEIRELNQIHSSNEPIGGGELVNPFSSSFDPRGSVPARKSNKPVNVFDR